MENKEFNLKKSTNLRGDDLTNHIHLGLDLFIKHHYKKFLSENDIIDSEYSFDFFNMTSFDEVDFTISNVNRYFNKYFKDYKNYSKEINYSRISSVIGNIDKETFDSIKRIK